MLKFSIRELLILAIPFVNAISFLLLYGLGENIFYYGAFRIAYLSIIIVYLFFFFRLTKSAIPIYLFLGYLLFLIPFSSNFLITSEFYLKVAVSLMMYPVGYWFVNSEKRFEAVTKSYVYSAVFLIIIFLVSQIFRIGEPAYSYEKGILLLGGNRGIYIANLLAYSGIIIFVLMDKGGKSKYSYIYKYIFASIVIIIVLIFRRSAVIALIAGLFIYFVFTGQKSKKIKYFLVVGLLLIIATPLYLDKLQLLFEVRSYQTLVDQEHGRIQDLRYSYDYITKLGFPHNLFGIELFNFQSHHDVNRTIHNDYAQLLHGSGFIGLILFLLIFLTIWWKAFLVMLWKRKVYMH
jgi:O-antigen ligase